MKVHKKDIWVKISSLRLLFRNKDNIKRPRDINDNDYDIKKDVVSNSPYYFSLIKKLEEFSKDNEENLKIENVKIDEEELLEEFYKESK